MTIILIQNIVNIYQHIYTSIYIYIYIYIYILEHGHEEPTDPSLSLGIEKCPK
jgi:hypothetical protein